MATEPKYQSSIAVAQRLGIPDAWLRREAVKGKMPHIRAGRRMLFSIDQVERTLAERAAGQQRGGGGDA